MRKIVQWMLVIGLAFSPVLSAAPAAATLLHTWVASTGNNQNNCDQPTPCASFQAAMQMTTAGGEITCVDSEDFGGLNPSISITINCENAIGNNYQPGEGTDNSFFINLTAADTVTLRGLDLDGGGSSNCEVGGSHGLITFVGAGTLRLQKMKINHFTGSCGGVFFNPSGAATLDITDSDITNNGSTGVTAGIYIGPTSGVQASVTINRTQVQGNYFGVIADGTQGGIIHGTISDSVVSGSTENGITASTTSSNVLLLIDQSTVSGSIHGLVAGGSTAAIMVRNTTVTGNTAAGLFTVNGGQLLSYGNNSVDGNNGNNGAFTGMATLK
jgi:hypothetical protein